MSNPADEQPTAIQFSMRLLLAAASAICLLLAVFTPLVRAQPANFRRQLIWSAVASGLIVLVAMLVLCWRRWRVESQGTLLYRTRHPKRWLELLPATMLLLLFTGLTAGVCLLLLPQVRDMSRLTTGAELDLLIIFSTVGAIAPGMVGLAYTCVMLWWGISPLSMEVRTQGIGIGALKFYRWSELGSCDWMEGPYGPVLVIKPGSRQLTVVMSEADRDAVQQLLAARGVVDRES